LKTLLHDFKQRLVLFMEALSVFATIASISLHRLDALPYHPVHPKKPATPAIYILPKSVYTDSLALTNYALGDTHPFF
jgi:hypothetical protein